MSWISPDYQCCLITVKFDMYSISYTENISTAKFDNKVSVWMKYSVMFWLVTWNFLLSCNSMLVCRQGNWNCLLTRFHCLITVNSNSACTKKQLTLNDPRGTVNFVSRESQCFPRRSRGKHWDSREIKFTVPQGTTHYQVICYRAKQNKSKIWKPRWDSSHHVQQRSTVNCWPGNSELFPVWRHSFRNVARSWHLAGNSLIVRCHVTMN